MSVFDSQVYKCELYTVKDVTGDKAFKYVIANKTPRTTSISMNSSTVTLSNSDELSLCPGCLRSLEEWMETSSVQAEEGLKETPLAKAFREFAETVKSIKTGL